MKHFFCNSFVWVVLLAIFYFASDIIDKGKVLNALTPSFPFLGYLMWVGIILVLWFLFFQPVIQFCRLGRAVPLSLEKQLNWALAKLAPYEDAPPGDDKRKLFYQVYQAWEKELWLSPERKVEVLKLVEQTHKQFDSDLQAREFIRSYSVAAGIGVVFCRNNLLDGLLLLVMQLRLVIALAKLHNYRPSPVFNACCLCWVLTNSLLTALAQGDIENATSSAVDYIAELFNDSEERDAAIAEATGDTASFLNLTGLPLGSLFGASAKVAKAGILFAAPAVIAGTSVYITGHIFLRRLKRDCRKLTMETLMELRAEGRREMHKDILSGLCSKLKLPTDEYR